MLHVVIEVLFLIHFAHSTLAEVVDMVDQARTSLYKFPIYCKYFNMYTYTYIYIGE